MESLTRDDYRVLLALLERGKMYFQQICDENIYGNRNTLHSKLIALKQRGFIQKEGGERGKGKKTWYSLTEKGKGECLRTALNNINESFKVVSRFLSEISRPSRLGEWRKMAREAFFNVEITEAMPLEERIKRFEEYTDEWYGPLRGCLRTLHEVFLKLTQPSVILESGYEDEYFIRINKEGGVYIIPEKVYKYMESQLEKLRVQHGE